MRTSASKVGLHMLCAYSARDDVRAPESSSPAGEKGTARHAILEYAGGILEYAGGSLPIEPYVWDAALLATAELTAADACAFASAARTWVSALPANTLTTELVYVYDVATDTARESPHKRTQDDPQARPGEIRCIADLVWDDDEDLLTVDDYKTGRIENVEPADQNWQMRTLGLAAARNTRRDRVRVRVIEVSDEGACRVASQVVLEPWDLEEIAASLRELAARIPTAEPVLGTWCRRKWCPLQGTCPATTAVASAAIVAPPTPTEASYPIIATPLSPQHAAYLLVVLDLVKAFSASLEGNLKAYAKTAPIPLGEGRSWGPVVSPTTTIETSDAAVSVLSQALGEKVTEALGITKASIERAAKLVTKRGEGAAKVREIMAALEAVGAVKHGNRTEYTEVVTNG